VDFEFQFGGPLLIFNGLYRTTGRLCSLFKRHVNGLLLHDFPDTKLGWTYDNRKKKPMIENTGALRLTDGA
jgi:hypothetical protein